MIPKTILEHLDKHGIAYVRLPHPRAITAQQLAASMHVTGHRVAKALVVEVDGQRQLIVLPAAEVLDERRLAQCLQATRVKLLTEREFGGMFPECELGAEPPFGRMYGLPVLVDARLARETDIVIRAGSHEEAIEMSYADFVALERPRVVDCRRPTKSAQTRRPAIVRI
jgi:Ala-tRNA(Pro) deacylase